MREAGLLPPPCLTSRVRNPSCSHLPPVPTATRATQDPSPTHAPPEHLLGHMLGEQLPSAKSKEPMPHSVSTEGERGVGGMGPIAPWNSRAMALMLSVGGVPLQGGGQAGQVDRR